MGYFALRKSMEILSDLIEYIFANKEEKIFILKVPHYCRKCAILHECRNKNNNWKCYHGCAFIGKNNHR